jgi:hypothetical protein
MRSKSMRRTSMHRAGIARVLALLACAMASHASAQQVVMYRCTDARGVVTLQNDTPCAKGTKQEKRLVDTGATAAPFPMIAPAPVVRPSARAPATAAQPVATTASVPSPVLPLPEASRPPAERLPPPPLYQCNTVENDSYLSDTSDPKPRCVRVDTVGIDGSQQLGAGSACSMVYDQCQRVPDNAACPAWRKRVNEAQAAWTYARADMAVQAKADYERIARVVAETTCNQ